MADPDIVVLHFLFALADPTPMPDPAICPIRSWRFGKEGSGSFSDADFANFLNMSRRSVFEVANILMILSKDNYLPTEKVQPLLSELEEQSRMLLAFRRSLKS